jgi:hypothetical protein
MKPLIKGNDFMYNGKTPACVGGIPIKEFVK